MGSLVLDHYGIELHEQGGLFYIESDKKSWQVTDNTYDLFWDCATGGNNILDGMWVGDIETTLQNAGLIIR